MGMRIDPEWAHEKLRIPVAEEGKPALGDSKKAEPPPAAPPVAAASRVVAAAIEPVPVIPDQAAVDAALGAIPPDVLQGAMDTLLAPVLAAIDGASGYEGAMAALSALYPQMDAAKLESLLARAMFAAEVWGAAHGDA